MSNRKKITRSVIIGNTNADVVTDSVIINQGDENGNIIFNQGGTAIGANARADSTSIAIGYNAGAGISPEELLSKLYDRLEEQKDDENKENLNSLVECINKKEVHSSEAKTLWEILNKASSLASISGLLLQFGQMAGLV